MIGELPPGLLLLLGALLVPLLPQRARVGYMLALPLFALYQVIGLSEGDLATGEIMGYPLILLRVDRLSRVFALVFLLAAFLSVLYSAHVRDTLQQVVGLFYAGSALGAVFAGDFITLFVYWELAAVSSVFLIWARRTERSSRAGMRYVVLQLLSGVVLLAGVLMRFSETGSLEVGRVVGPSGELGYGELLILLAFGLKCAFPVLHVWLTDAYPEATVTGTVFLSAFTTKMAVYALARCFPGTEELVWVGVVMATFPIFFAVIENDLRRVLAYSMINQLGFMVVGVGIGTELALNGTAAHAFADIIFKGLLFMSMGAVLYRVGTTNGSDLGGLYKSMPWTATFCIVGAASISAFPLFSAFATKSLIMSAVMEEERFVAWLFLLFASAGVFHHAGIKIPFFAFFAHDRGHRVQEAPGNMLAAMALGALLCLFIGMNPSVLYDLLPFAVDYQPYTVTHVVTQLQLLCFAALAFSTLVRTGIYPPELRSVNLDVDWVYRRAVPAAVTAFRGLGGRIGSSVRSQLRDVFAVWLHLIRRLHAPAGLLGEPWPTGTTAFWAAVLLLVFLLISYW